MNERHRAFVEEYLINGYNATTAYQKVYPKATYKTAIANGARLLTNAEIQGFLQSKKEETAKRNNISKDEIIGVIASIMNNGEAKHNDRLKATEILLKALGYNEPDKIINNISTSSNLKDLLGFDE